MPAGRRPYLALLHHASFGWRSAASRELVVGAPVRGRVKSVEDAGCAEQEGAGAHRRRVRGVLVNTGDPVDDGVAVTGEAPGDESTGHEEHAGCGDLVEGVGDVEVQEPNVVGEVALLRRAEYDLGIGEEGEHLVGADGVEGGEARIESDGDLQGFSLGHDARQVKCCR